MDKVYLLVTGESIYGDRVEGVYASVHSAMTAAEAAMDNENKESGMQFRSDLCHRRGGRIEWRCDNQYIAVEERDVL